jgi:hypothetical protein
MLLEFCGFCGFSPLIPLKERERLEENTRFPKSAWAYSSVPRASTTRGHSGRAPRNWWP